MRARPSASVVAATTSQRLGDRDLAGADRDDAGAGDRLPIGAEDESSRLGRRANSIRTGGSSARTMRGRRCQATRASLPVAAAQIAIGGGDRRATASAGTSRGIGPSASARAWASVGASPRRPGVTDRAARHRTEAFVGRDRLGQPDVGIGSRRARAVDDDARDRDRLRVGRGGQLGQGQQDQGAKVHDRDLPPRGFDPHLRCRETRARIDRWNRLLQIPLIGGPEIEEIS